MRVPDRFNHEYWPWYLIYLPVFPAALWHALRSGHWAFFTNVNPSIDLGGFFGERKSEIYALLPSGSYPTTVLIEPGMVSHVIRTRMYEAGLELPLIAKPDVGERGEGVVRVNTAAELEALCRKLDRPTLLQAFVPWTAEYGLMFVKDPLTGRTSLLSITGKAFLTVTGDGVHRVRELLARSWRGAMQIERLLQEQPALMGRIPALNEEVLVEPVGNHCRGTRFLNAGHLATSELKAALDKVLGATEGIHYGRMDVRAESEAALRRGEFVILELNGVTSEPGHIYDPRTSIFSCWAELLRHVRHIPRISRTLVEQGHRPASLRTIRERYRQHFVEAGR